MNAAFDPEPGRRATLTLGKLAWATVVTVLQGLRIVLFAVLAVCAPVVCGVLSLAALTCFVTCGLYALAAPPGLKFPYAVGLTIGVTCAAGAVLYEMLVRALRP